MKNNSWFSHDSNAKDDEKMMFLIEELGLEGYGIYWVLVEKLREEKGYKCSLKMIPILARRYNTTTAKMEAVIHRYDLFQIEEQCFFFSNSLKDRMQIMDNKKENMKALANKRWNKNKELPKPTHTDTQSDTQSLRKANAMRTHTDTHTDMHTDTQCIIKEKKRKESIAHFDNASVFSFAEFWEAYEKKKDRYKAEKIYNKLSEQDRQVIKDTIALYIQSTPEIKFRKFPCTYLNNRSWEDEIVNYDSKPEQEVLKRTVRTLND